MEPSSANFGLSWAREFAEQTLNQSKAALDGFLKASNKMAEDFESSVIRHSRAHHRFDRESALKQR